MKIRIKHICRVEGHLGFFAHLLNGEVKKAKIEVKEGVRLIEGILVNRHFSEAPIITSRICGICPVIHNLTSIKAIEKALNVKIRPEVILLRKLMLAGQIIHSHALHLFFLSLPDFLNFSSDLTQIKKYPKQTKAALKIREFGNKIIETIGGQAIHPISSQIGGFKKYPLKSALENLYRQTNEILLKAIELAIFFRELKYPKFERSTNFVSLSNSKEYAVYEGDIKFQISNHKFEIINLFDFYKKIQEIQIGVVKRTKYNQKIYMLGAMARINNNSTQLNKEARKIFESLTLKESDFKNNTFYNVLSQAIEIVHFIEESQKLLKQILKIKTYKLNSPTYKLKNLQTGLAACEAPRGTLFHYYEIDKEGLIKNCNIITPTAQFLNNLEADLKIWLPKVKKFPKKEREKRIKMLVRAYDPCITCATH